MLKNCRAWLGWLGQMMCIYSKKNLKFVLSFNERVTHTILLLTPEIQFRNNSYTGLENSSEWVPHWAVQLTYQQNAWNDIQCTTKTREFTLRHNVQRHLGQSEDLIFWVLLVTRTCNVWCNKLFRHFVRHRTSFQILSIH